MATVHTLSMYSASASRYGFSATYSPPPQRPPLFAKKSLFWLFRFSFYRPGTATDSSGQCASSPSSWWPGLTGLQHDKWGTTPTLQQDPSYDTDRMTRP